MEQIQKIELKENVVPAHIEQSSDENKRIVITKSNTYERETSVADIKRDIDFRVRQIAGFQAQNDTDTALIARIASDTGLKVSDVQPSITPANLN